MTRSQAARIRGAGSRAFLQGIDTCPHPPGSPEASAWRDGWARAYELAPSRGQLIEVDDDNDGLGDAA